MHAGAFLNASCACIALRIHIYFAGTRLCHEPRREVDEVPQRSVFLPQVVSNSLKANHNAEMRLRAVAPLRQANSASICGTTIGFAYPTPDSAAGDANSSVKSKHLHAVNHTQPRHDG